MRPPSGPAGAHSAARHLRPTMLCRPPHHNDLPRLELRPKLQSTQRRIACVGKQRSRARQRHGQRGHVERAVVLRKARRGTVRNEVPARPHSGAASDSGDLHLPSRAEVVGATDLRRARGRAAARQRPRAGLAQLFQMLGRWNGCVSETSWKASAYHRGKYQRGAVGDGTLMAKEGNSWATSTAHRCGDVKHSSRRQAPPPSKAPIPLSRAHRRLLAPHPPPVQVSEGQRGALTSRPPALAACMAPSLLAPHPPISISIPIPRRAPHLPHVWRSPAPRHR